MCCLPYVLQWYLTHTASGDPREKPYSSNLLDPAAVEVLVGFLQWLDSGMPGYKGRAKGKKLVGAPLCQQLCWCCTLLGGCSKPGAWHLCLRALHMGGTLGGRAAATHMGEILRAECGHLGGVHTCHQLAMPHALNLRQYTP